MGRLLQVTADEHRTPAPSPMLTSRRHIDFLRVRSAIGATR
ncbi:hypothetical protein [Streptomyces sp. WAC 04229]